MKQIGSSFRTTTDFFTKCKWSSLSQHGMTATSIDGFKKGLEEQHGRSGREEVNHGYSLWWVYGSFMFRGSIHLNTSCWEGTVGDGLLPVDLIVGCLEPCGWPLWEAVDSGRDGPLVSSNKTVLNTHQFTCSEHHDILRRGVYPWTHRRHTSDTYLAAATGYAPTVLGTLDSSKSIDKALASSIGEVYIFLPVMIICISER